MSRSSSLQALLDWPPGEPLPAETPPLSKRLVAAVHGLADGSSGAGDVAALLRQALSAQQLRAREEGLRTTSVVTVPSHHPWPTSAQWQQHNLSCAPAGGERHALTRNEWAPSWLDEGSLDAVNDAIARKPRRIDRRIDADPLLTTYLPGTTKYLTLGQREAVRAAFLARDGGTIVVNLPTGAGKTLAFQVPAVKCASDGGVVLVIVPTIALALDHATRFSELIEGTGITCTAPLAYHSGLSNEEKMAVRHAVADGTTPILFTSPEAALGALRKSLLQAATSGKLRLFAIDEAHVVATWGDEFRPEFQALAGLRSTMRNACPPGHGFRTMLLSATIPGGVYDLLIDLFGDGDPESVDLVAEVSLRPEPAYLLNAASSEEERKERVLEALRFLPRPLLLYTTLRIHARNWEVLLRQQGNQRVASVIGGDMSSTDGAAVLAQWRAGELDVVVATSAFGLGMDQSDVRSVVHACIPEDIDRYYQEVGRAGRDGNAAVALLISAPDDLERAKRLGTYDPIGLPRIQERWNAMFGSSQKKFVDDIHLLPLDALVSTIPYTSPRNRSWNLRVLAMMVRAGMLAFAAAPPPSIVPKNGETDEDFEIRRVIAFKRFALQAGIKILLVGEAFEQGWTRVKGILEERREEEERVAAQIGELQAQTQPLEKTLASAYEIPRIGLTLRGQYASCPMTRKPRTAPKSSHDPKLFTFTAAPVLLGNRLRACFDDWRDEHGTLWLRLDPAVEAPHEQRAQKLRLERLFQRLAAEGIVTFQVPRTEISSDTWKHMLRVAPRGAVTCNDPARESLAKNLQHLSTLLLLPDDLPADDLRRRLRTLDTTRPAPRIVLVPPLLLDPDRSDRLLLDTRRHHSISQVQDRLN